MDRNTLMAFVLSMVVYTTWVLYTGGFQPPPEPEPGAAVEEQLAGEGEAAREPDASAAGGAQAARPSDSPGAPARPGPEAGGEKGYENTLAYEPPSRQAPVIEREFELGKYIARVSTEGGTLVGWTLRDYDEALDEARPDERTPIELIRIDDSTGGALQTPLRELAVGDLSRAVFEIERETDRSIDFVLKRGGYTVRKQLSFDAEGYGFELAVSVENGTGRPVSPNFEVVWPAVASEDLHFRELSLAALHDGREETEVYREMVSSYGSPGFFSRFLGSGEFEPVELRGDVQWAGIDVKYFVAALLPGDLSRDTEVRFDVLGPGAAATRVFGSELAILPGDTQMRRYAGFAGPKKDELLESVGHGLQESVDLGYSWVSPLTRFFRWLLRSTYAVVPNYGVAIILITIMVRIMTMPIMMRQMKSMEKMRELQPRLKKLQEEHADDRQKQSEEMMKLYRETGVNPIAGCFPMLLQFPVFIGLFYALQSSIDLWQAPFIFWIDDLSAPESLFTIPGLGLPVRMLPVIMAGSMVLQQKLTPTTVDPAQETMMLIMMPAMMLVLFYQFPSGLVLYWMVSNFLGIAHQLWVRRGMQQEKQAKPA